MFVNGSRMAERRNACTEAANGAYAGPDCSRRPRGRGCRPSPGAVYLTDEDYEIAVNIRPGSSGDVWLFGYGSLLWKPAFEYVESRMASVRGYHRSFCIRVACCGTRDLPGL